MSPTDTWAFPVGDALGPGRLSCVKAAAGRCRAQFHITGGPGQPPKRPARRGQGCRMLCSRHGGRDSWGGGHSVPLPAAPDGPWAQPYTSHRWHRVHAWGKVRAQRASIHIVMITVIYMLSLFKLTILTF